MLLAAFAVQETAAGVTAEQALQAYGRMTAVASAPDRPCPAGTQAEIVVCARQEGRRYRLPLSEERFAPGEVVRHPSEAPSTTDAWRGPPQEPSHLMETLGKLVGGAKSLITGEDPGY